MDDNRKKPNRSKPPRAFAKSDSANGGAGGKPFRKHDGPRPFRKDGEEGKPFRSSGPRPFRKDGEQGDRPSRSDGPRPFRKDGEQGDRPFRSSGPRPFRKDGEQGDRPFRSSGPRPFRKDGEQGDRPTRSDGPRPFRKDGEQGDRPFRSSDPRPFRKDGEQGDRPFRPSGPRPFRKDGEEGGKPFRKHDGPRSFDTERKPRRDDDAPRRYADRPMNRRGDAPREDWAEGERIAKRLARAGISSRREAEILISAGRVSVNGKVVETPALNVFETDRIELDGTEIPAIERTRLFLFHKPAGVVTTNRDPEGRKTVFEVLPENLPRLMTVGRLDINTEGLLLLTNDGGLSRILELPATGWLRRYRVRVHGEVDEARLATLKEGIAVEGVFYGAVEAELERVQGTNAWLTLGLREGKNREVKNILGALGLEVTRLIRISYGPFQLGELPEGHVLEIKGRMLREQLGERLIEESGANFDADVSTPFPNKPVRRGQENREEFQPARRPREMNVGEGGLVKGGGFRRDRDRDRGREDALGRLSTKPERKPFGDRPKPDGRKERGDKPFGDRPKSGGRKERDDKPIEPPGARRANVWMAPGARPQAKKPSERAAERREREDDGQQRRDKPRSFAGEGGKPFRKREDDRPQRPGGKSFSKPGSRPFGKPGGKPPRKG